MSSFTEAIRCTYCLEELKYLIEPKLLDCGDVFCKECMTPQILADGSFQCPTCRRVYENIDVESLKSATDDVTAAADDSSVEKSASEPEVAAEPVVLCDRCEGDSPAAGYCSDCGVKCCTKHLEFHNGYFEGLHNTMDIDKYLAKVNSFNKTLTCATHPKEQINMACKKCYLYNCLQCDDDNLTPTCNGSFTDHIYLPLKRVEKEIRREFESLLKRSAEKVEEMALIEKRLWLRLDETQEQCKKMIAEVKVKTEEQIAQIQQQSAALITEISQYEQDKTKKVIDYLEQLMNKKEGIDAVRVSAHKFLGDVHIRELIIKKKSRCEEIQTANQTDLGSCNWTDKKLRIGQKRKMEIQFWEQKPIQNINYRGHGPPEFFQYGLPSWR